jgi:hypothetical protein
MKKLLSLLVILILGFVLIGCTEKRDAAIPMENPSHIIVYNAGTIIYEAKSVDGTIEIAAEKIKVNTLSFGDTSEFWLVYYITQNGVTTKIIDSNSLSIVWYD